MPELHATSLPPDVLAGEGFAPACGVAFTEGPACAADGTVYFSDIANNRICRYHPDSARFDVFREPSGRANGLLFDVEGRLLACEGNEFGTGLDGGRRITRTCLKTGEIEILTDRVDGVHYNAPNDIAARSNGQIFFTDPCYGDRSLMQLQHESVYRIDTNGKVHRLITQPDIERPNGVALAPDEATLYVVDSCPTVGGNRKIWAFDLDDAGEVSNQRVAFDFAPGRGGDGMAVDSLGRLFIAAGIEHPRGPHETTDVPPGIWVVEPDGTLVGRIPIPEDVLTNVTFGGDDLRTLYVTAGKTLFQTRVATPGWVVHRTPQQSD